MAGSSVLLDLATLVPDKAYLIEVRHFLHKVGFFSFLLVGLSVLHPLLQTYVGNISPEDRVDGVPERENQRLLSFDE